MESYRFMYKLGLAYHKAFMLHDTGPDHPECSERIEAIMQAIQSSSWSDLVEVVEAREATVEEVALVHNPRYIEAMRRICEAGGQFLPALEAAVGPESYPAALRAVGAGLTLADSVMKGRWKLGFAPVRPPGHHAVFSRPRGFCIFNNIAILAKYLIERYNLTRIGILDFDVHHGNGTEHAFWTDSQVLYCSIHRENYFPGDTGNWDDIGEGEGKDYTINIPMPAQSQDKAYLEAIDKYATPRILEYKPQIMLVSAGFDGHWRDLLGGMRLTDRAYEEFGKRVKAYAAVDGQDRIITMLEGGYDLIGNAEGINGYLGALI